MKKSALILLLGLLPALLFSQNISELKGRCVNGTDNGPVEMAAVVIKELNRWTVTDMQGEFVIQGIPAGKYTLQATCLGFELYEGEVTLPYRYDSITVLMSPSTLALDEVVVTAKEGKTLGSTSSLQQSAIEHIQPTDLSDVLQLVPGSVVSNPDMSGTKQLSVRDIDAINDPNASLGTLLIIDGAPVSNDANMQVMKTTGASSGNLATSFASTATGGADMRQIPTDNIESVEVVRGIAGAEDGDMLSGAVKVKLKKGKTPLVAKVKADPYIKQAYAGKGIGLPSNLGAVNLDFDITQSFKDLRIRYKSFNRFSGSAAYTATVFRNSRPLNLRLTTTFTRTNDRNEQDPDLLDYELYESTDNKLNTVFSGDWALNSALLTNLDFTVSGTYQHQVSREIEQENLNGPSPQPISRVAGEFVAPYLPSAYVSDITIDGRPSYLFASLKGDKVFHISGFGLSNTKAGVEFKRSGNNGDGRVYDTRFPPTPTSTSDARPRSYKDIPSLSQLALFAEENLDLDIGSTQLSLQAGLRFTNVQPEAVFRSAENTTMLDPRLNLRYTLIDNPKRKLKQLKLRLGYGVFSKAPTLLHYYPDKAYFDRVSFNYYEPPNEFFVITTKVIDDTRNYDLEPAVNRKLEGGIDMNIGKIKLNLTAFMEKMTGGFSFDRCYDNFIYNNYNEIAAGLEPYYVDGSGVYYIDPVTSDEIKVPSVNDTVFVSYSQPNNNVSTDKKGIELSLNLGKIEKLRTSVIIDGAYLHIRKQDMADYLIKPVSTYMGGQYPLVGLFPGGNGSIDERLNTNIRTVTHIKELKMVLTLVTQVIWFERRRSIYEDANGNVLVYTQNPTDDPYTDIDQIKYIDALGYYDYSMTYHTFAGSPDLEKPYSDLMDPIGNPYYFNPLIYPPTFQINLRLTKEISDLVMLSFYANNLTNYRPLQKIKGRLEYYTRRNQPIYFGAELKFKF